MLRYNTLRQVTLALRWATVVLLNLKQRADVTAQLMADNAKQAGLDVLQRQEDKAFANVLTVKANSDDILTAAEEALTKVYDLRELIEDKAHADYVKLCDHTAEMRAKIEGEVL